jgi:hypothetical protein
MGFASKLVVTEFDEIKWELVTPLVYQGNQDRIEVPTGFITDFASVPKALWSIIPPYGTYTKAAVIHDYLYRNAIVSRADADGIFKKIMSESGVGLIRRGLMWAAVRLFGRAAYKGTKPNSEPAGADNLPGR